MANTTSNTSVKTKLPSTSIRNHTISLGTEHFMDERYPKTCLEQKPPVILEYPPPQLRSQPSRSRNSLRFRTQPVTLTEIYETEEDDHQQPQQQTEAHSDFDRFERLALSENLRRTGRKKAPLKNFLERQRLKERREELSETDGN
jgi:hypothetical protein